MVLNKKYSLLDPILPGRAGLYLSMLIYALKYNRDFAVEHYLFYKSMVDYLGVVKDLRILDVGCGKSFWLTLLLHNHGGRVTGVDTEVVRPGFSKDKYLDMLQKNGIERTLRTFVWEQVFARSYYNKLASLCDFPLVFDGIDLQPIDGFNFDFPDNTFDLIVSHEVFEHIADLHVTLAGLNRILKPDGRTYIYIHNYTSLSGGHHIAWKLPDSKPSKKVPPWDHLRENKYPYIPSSLNKMRMHEYRPAFEQYFHIKDWIPGVTEGKRLLTGDIRSELCGYNEEELLTKGFTVVASPKK